MTDLLCAYCVLIVEPINMKMMPSFRMEPDVWSLADYPTGSGEGVERILEGFAFKDVQGIQYPGTPITTVAGTLVCVKHLQQMCGCWPGFPRF